MAKFKTHYDNLNVARNAPLNVIKAAYKVLCQNYHPDKYAGGHEEALRIMKIINEAYAVLSDPDKRAEHDRWINRQERDHATHKAQRIMAIVAKPGTARRLNRAMYTLNTIWATCMQMASVWQRTANRLLFCIVRQQSRDLRRLPPL